MKLSYGYNCQWCFKKNPNASRPSEHPPVRGGKMSKCLSGIIGCKDKTSSWHLIGFPNGSNIGSRVQYRAEAHRYVILYTWGKREAAPRSRILYSTVYSSMQKYVRGSRPLTCYITLFGTRVPARLMGTVPAY